VQDKASLHLKQKPYLAMHTLATAREATDPEFFEGNATYNNHRRARNLPTGMASKHSLRDSSDGVQKARFGTLQAQSQPPETTKARPTAQRVFKGGNFSIPRQSAQHTSQTPQNITLEPRGGSLTISNTPRLAEKTKFSGTVTP
jgi:hypothetical protein